MAVLSVFEFIEYSEGIELTDREWNDPHFQQVLELAGSAYMHSNDLVSFGKEYEQQGLSLERTPNAVAQVVLRDKCSVDEALKRVVHSLEELEKKTRQAIDSLVADPKRSANQKQFCDALQYAIGGYSYSGFEMIRYTQW